MDTVAQQQLHSLIAAAFEEDLPDCSSEATVSTETRVCGLVKAKQAGIICGVEVITSVFDHLPQELQPKKVQIKILVHDGAHVEAGTLIAVVLGPARAILAAERTLLNFLQRLSGISSLSATFADAVKGTKCRVLDTRKTTPGYRFLEKYAVRCGFCVNHRMSLSDMIMIKDNHITCSGSITKAVELSRKIHPKIPIEVEVATFEQLTEVLAIFPFVDRVMLDNMSCEMMRDAVKQTAGAVPLEASGGVTLETIAKIAATGVDFVSVGALTHSAKSLDINMKVQIVSSDTSIGEVIAQLR